MRSDPSAVIIEKMMNYVGENSVRSFLKVGELSDYEIHQIYSIALSSKLNQLVVDILKETSLASIFEFLEGKQFEWIEERKLHLLELPSFSTKERTFKEVIQDLTGNDFNRHVLKKFGELTEKFGIRCLNNFKTLKNIYRNKKFKLNDFFKIDHSISLGRSFEFEIIMMGSFLRNYSALRCSKLIMTNNNKISWELRNLITSLDQADEVNILKKLPRKPKSLEEIKIRIEKELAKLVPLETILNQSIFHLNSEVVDDYQIYIPNTVQELNDLSSVLENCLNRYARKIIKKECEVLILTKNGEPKIVVELKIKDTKKRITQFLGPKNNNYYEGIRGKELRDKLLARVNLSK